MKPEDTAEGRMMKSKSPRFLVIGQAVLVLSADRIAFSSFEEAQQVAKASAARGRPVVLLEAREAWQRAGGSLRVDYFPYRVSDVEGLG